MNVIIMNYKGTKKCAEVGCLDNVLAMMINIVSGDEILYVSYKDGTMKKFASDNAFIGFQDGNYPIYLATDLEDSLIFNQEWLNRKDSYEGQELFYAD